MKRIEITNTNRLKFRLATIMLLSIAFALYATAVMLGWQNNRSNMSVWVAAMFLLNLGAIPAVLVSVRGDKIFRLLVLCSWVIVVSYLAVRTYLFFSGVD